MVNVTDKMQSLVITVFMLNLQKVRVHYFDNAKYRPSYDVRILQDHHFILKRLLALVFSLIYFQNGLKALLNGIWWVD